MPSLEDARKAAIRSALTRQDWDGQPWACPQCPLYLIQTLDGQHWACVSGESHGIYVILHGERAEVYIEPPPVLAGSEAPPVAQGAAENGGQGNLSPGGESHSIMAVARHMEQDNQRDAEIKRLTAEVERLRAALEIAATGEPLPTKAMVAWAAGCRCGRHHPTGRHLKGRGPCLVKNCRCKYGRPATPALSDAPPQPPGQP